MADNRIYENAKQLSLTVSHPASPSSGDPVRIGNLTGVALTDERTDGTTTVNLGPSAFDLSVKGVNGTGDVAVAVGDPLYYVDADIDDGTGFLSKKSTGYFFGHALEAVTSGATATIIVKLETGDHEEIVPGPAVISESVAFGDFTDNTDTTGYVDLTPTLPAGAIPLGCKFVVSTGFTGDTTAVVQAGIDGDLDRFTLNTDQSVLAAASVGSLPATDAADGLNAASTVRVTVTGAADFTSISAGVMVVYVYYLATV